MSSVITSHAHGDPKKNWKKKASIESNPTTAKTVATWNSTKRKRRSRTREPTTGFYYGTVNIFETIFQPSLNL